MNVLLRHAGAVSGDAEDDIETILTEAATGRRHIWAWNLLFAELRPSVFAPGRFPSLGDFVRYLRSVVTFVAPDPNTMLRAARLRDVEWRRRGDAPGEPSRRLSRLDAIHLAAALWVKETGVPDLEFLAFETAGRAGYLSVLRLQDYAEDQPSDVDVLAALRLARAEPVLRSRPAPLPASVD